MAYEAGNLILLAHGADRKLYKYQTTVDTLRTITSANKTYFGVIEGGLDATDLMWVKGSDAEGMFRVSAVGTNSTTVTLEPVNEVFALPTASTTANLVPYGIFRSTASGSTLTFTLDMPLGIGAKKILAVTLSTALTVQTASTAVGSIDSTGVSILFNAANQAVELTAFSTANWTITARSQPGTAIIGPVTA